MIARLVKIKKAYFWAHNLIKAKNYENWQPVLFPGASGQNSDLWP